MMNRLRAGSRGAGIDLGYARYAIVGMRSMVNSYSQYREHTANASHSLRCSGRPVLHLPQESPDPDEGQPVTPSRKPPPANPGIPDKNPPAPENPPMNDPVVPEPEPADPSPHSPPIGEPVEPSDIPPLKEPPGKVEQMTQRN